MGAKHIVSTWRSSIWSATLQRPTPGMIQACPRNRVSQDQALHHLGWSGRLVSTLQNNTLGLCFHFNQFSREHHVLNNNLFYCLVLSCCGLFHCLNNQTLLGLWGSTCISGEFGHILRSNILYWSPSSILLSIGELLYRQLQTLLRWGIFNQLYRQ